MFTFFYSTSKSLSLSNCIYLDYFMSIENNEASLNTLQRHSASEIHAHTRAGRGGKSIYGHKFQDEITKTLKHTGAGILSMANSGPNTNGSQFFVTLAPTPWLDGKHTIFGRIAAGMGVIKRLGNVQTDDKDRPTTTVRIVQTWKGGIEDKPNQTKELMRMVQ